MRSRHIRLVSFTAILALVSAVPALTAGAKGTGPKLSIVKVAPQDDGGEPSVAVGPEGNIYVSYPADGGMDFYRSTNGGKTFEKGGLAENSSGDTSVNTDSSGAVYQSNLTFDGLLLQADVYKSKDHGSTWPQKGTNIDGSSSSQPFLVDRQWTDVYIPPGKTTDQALVYLSYHDWVPSQVWVNVSTDGGKTFGPPVDVISSPEAEAATFCNSIPGGVKVVQSGPHAGRVYVAWLAADAPTSIATGCNITMLDTFHSVWTAWSDDNGQTWTDQLVYDGGFGHDASGLFADLTLDNQGNPYVAFADNLKDEWDMYVMASFDGGKTWNGKSDGTAAPYKVNTDQGTHLFPAIAAGDPGKVDVAWIATSSVVPTTPWGKPEPGGDPDAKWYTYMAQSLNLTSGHPTWTVVQATRTPIHTGDVCVLGIFCVFPSSDRSLLDFIDIAVDQKGLAHVVYTANQTKETEGIYEALQVGGSRVS